ncbi:MAG: universal stress protein [Rhizobiales bacterium]|nr:universal stress protein [Hyphomicrobiales bacterium]
MREVACPTVATPEPAGRRLRQSYEPGHRPKFLVLVDDTDDCKKAVHYASRRAMRVGANVVLLRVIDAPPADVAWFGVAEVMQSEAMEEAQQLLNSYAAIVKNVGPEEPETLIRQGEVAAEMFKLIEEDEDIAVLVLAAGSSNQGPGPLISELGRTAGTYPIPIVVVPAHLSDAELDALS